MFLKAVCHQLNQSEVDYALVGGFAVALHGAVRGTVDIDVIIRWDELQLKKVEQALLKLGLVSRLPIDAEMLFQFRNEYIMKRNLIAWNFYHPKDASQQVDVIITEDLAGKDTVTKTVDSEFIKILGIKDLIGMKKKSGRPQDLEDIKALKNLL